MTIPLRSQHEVRGYGARRPSRSHAVRLAVLACALLVGTPVVAPAHTRLEQGSPASGAKLDAAPEEVRLTFSEAVVLAFTRITLTGPAGEVELAPITFAPGSRNVVVAPIRGPLDAGAYIVAWQVAGGDGHPIRGEYSFSIAAGAAGLTAPAAPAPIAPAPGQPAPPAAHHPTASVASSSFDAESPLYSAVRWLNFLGLLGMMGAVAFRLVLVVVRRQEPQLAASLVAPASTRAAKLGLWMTAIAAVATLLRLYAQSYALHGGENALNAERLGTLLGQTLWGWGWWLAVVGVLLAFFGFLLASRARPYARVARPLAPAGAVPAVVGPECAAATAPTADEAHQTLPADARAESEPATAVQAGSDPALTGWALAAVAVVAAAFSPAMSGHAAAARLAPLPILTDGLHVLGAGGWLGSLLVLLVVGIPVALHLPSRDRGPGIAVLVNAFSPSALFFAGLVVGTGVFAAWLQLGRVPALWESSYGRVLILKLAVLSVVFGTGAYNWLRVKPALGEEAAAGRLRRSATLELAVGAVVLAVTAVLVATPTPTDATGMREAAHDAETVVPAQVSVPGSATASPHE